MESPSIHIPFPSSGWLALAAIPLFLLLSCGGSGDSGPSGPATPLATSLTITPDSLLLDSIGATVQFTATVRDQNGQMMSGAPLFWSSSAPAVASVSPQGLVTALADGTTTIRATSGNVGASSRVFIARVLFTPHPLEATYNGNAGLVTADMEGDGDTDFISTSVNDDQVALWRNDGGRPLIWTKVPVGGTFEAPLYVHAADVDRDTRMDIVATGGGPAAGVVAWWRNDGGDPAGWPMQTIAQDFMGASGIASGDFDGDGNTDLLAAAIHDSEIAWWRNSGADPVVWTKNTITDEFGSVQSVMATDLDGDGRLDVLGGSSDGPNRDQVAWWHNEGGDPVQWAKHVIADLFMFAHWVYAEDMDGDGRTDVLAVSYHSGEVAWWRNEGGAPLGWTKHVIASGFPHPLTVCPSDLDNDGDMDVVATAGWPTHQVAWWESTGGFPTIQWREHTVEGSFTGAWPLAVADLDGDGDQDVVAGADVLDSGGQSAPLTWWESLRSGGE